MYKVINWDFIQSFDVDPITKSLTKINSSEEWNSRAYSSAYSIINYAGLKNLHNDNINEITEYAIGWVKTTTQFISSPEDITYGFYFVEDRVELLHEGNIVLVLDSTNDNAEYLLRRINDKIYYFIKQENEDKEIIISLQFNDFLEYRNVVISKKNYETEIELMFNEDGIYTGQFNKVEYLKQVIDTTTGETSDEWLDGLEDSASIPYTTSHFRFSSTKFEIYQESVNSESIKIIETESGKTVPFTFLNSGPNFIEIIPTVGGGENETSLKPNMIYNVSLSGFSTILTETVWTTYRRFINSEAASNWSASQIVAGLWNTCYFDGRTPADIEITYYVDLLVNEIITKTEFVDMYISGPAQYSIENDIIGFVEIPWDSTSGDIKYADEYQQYDLKQDQLQFDLFNFIFKTETELLEILPSKFNEFVNDIYFKSRNINKLINPDDIISETAKLFNFKYDVTEYDAEQNRYDETGTILEFNNSNIIEELFVNQYMPEYNQFFNDMNRISVIQKTDIDNLKSLLLKNITLLNYFKGNKEQMEFLLLIFSNSVGYFLVSIDPDPYENFVYRLSTTLPKKYWDGSIKPITHPLGWDELFIEIPSDATNPTDITFWTDKEWAERKIIESYSITPAYLDYARIDADSGRKWLPRGTQGYNALADDFLSEKEFRFAITEYSPNLDYQNELWLGDSTAWIDRGGIYHYIRSLYPKLKTDGLNDEELEILLREWNDSTSKEFAIRHTMDFRPEVPIHKLELTLNGIATRYIWDVYEKGKLVFSKTTLTPYYNFTQYKRNTNYTVRLTLAHVNGWRKNIYTFVIPIAENISLTNMKSHIPVNEYQKRYFEETFDNFWDSYNGSTIENMKTHYWSQFLPAEYNVTLDSTALDNFIEYLNTGWIEKRIIGITDSTGFSTPTYLELNFVVNMLENGTFWNGEDLWTNLPFNEKYYTTLSGIQSKELTQWKSLPLSIPQNIFDSFIWTVHDGTIANETVINIIETKNSFLIFDFLPFIDRTTENWAITVKGKRDNIVYDLGTKIDINFEDLPPI